MRDEDNWPIGRAGYEYDHDTLCSRLHTRGSAATEEQIARRSELRAARQEILADI
jgi:hypothetical protein